MFISVHDPEEALGFYRDALGFEVRNDVKSGDFRWVTVGSPEQDLDIVLSQPHGGRSQTEGDALLALVTQGSLQAAHLPHGRPRLPPSRRCGPRAPRFCRSRPSSPGA